MSREIDLKLNDDTGDKIAFNDNNNNNDEESEADLLVDEEDKISAKDVRLALCEDKEARVNTPPDNKSVRCFVNLFYSYCMSHTYIIIQNATE